MAKISRIRNTLEGRKKHTGLTALMTPRVIISLVLIGIFSFISLVILSGYSDDLRQKNNGQAHALSRSAIGFGGLVRLLGDLDYDVGMARTENVSRAQKNTLRVFTLSRTYQANTLDDLNLLTPTLVIMPKWNAIPITGKSGWLKKRNGSPTMNVRNHERDLKELTGEVTFSAVKSEDKSLTYDLRSPKDMPTLSNVSIERFQTFSGDNLEFLYTGLEGTVLARIADTSIYILSDPDLLNTMGISTKTHAKFAVNLIDAIIEHSKATPKHINFDLTLHGFGSKTNIIKILTQPPFLAATLCLLAAGGLIAWQAFSRFGDPRKIKRDYALGKFSLADNAARFIRIAGREPNMAKDYTAIIRKQVIKDLNLKGRRQQDINPILRHREKSLDLPNSYVDLQNRAKVTNNNTSLMQLAEDLDIWKTKMILGKQNEP